MKKYVKFVIGILLILMSAQSVILPFSDTLEKSGRRIVENGTDTIGTIEKRTKHTVKARWGRVGGWGSYYTMTYNFRTAEGELYGGELNISKEQALAAHDGQQIKIRYMKGQPSINSPTQYREYMTAEQAKDVPLGPFIFGGLLFFAGGVWLTWSSWRQIRSARRPNPITRTVGCVPPGNRASGATIGRRARVAQSRGNRPLFGK